MRLVVKPLGRSAAELVEMLVSRSMGWLHGYYAKAAVESGVARVLVAYVDLRPVGLEVLYEIPLNSFRACVHYYIVVLPEFRGKGLGKVLVASAEELCGNASIYAASTTLNNEVSRRLFKSMGYEEYTWDRLEELAGYNGATELMAALCGYEDDVVYLKPCRRSLEELFSALKRGARASRRVWKRVCLDPWYALWRTLYT